MYDLDIHSIYTAEINKVSSNPRDLIHYDTSNHFVLCGTTVQTFDECELLKNHDLLKRNCIQLSLCKKLLNQLQMDWSTSSISQLNTKNETGVFDPYFVMAQE